MKFHVDHYIVVVILHDGDLSGIGYHQIGEDTESHRNYRCRLILACIFELKQEGILLEKQRGGYSIQI